jgi:hypothetical protein
VICPFCGAAVAHPYSIEGGQHLYRCADSCGNAFVTEFREIYTDKTRRRAGLACAAPFDEWPFRDHRTLAEAFGKPVRQSPKGDGG